MTEELDIYEDGNIFQESYQHVQALLDRFVAVNYETALNAVKDVSEINGGYCGGQIMDIIRNNPPLESVPKYLHDGRPNYVWYSDFYFDAGREVFLQYGQYIVPDIKITPANYAAELAKIDLPYFKELVNLVSLEKLCAEAGKHISATKSAPDDDPEKVEEIVSVEENESEQLTETESQPESIPTPEPERLVQTELKPEPTSMPEQIPAKRSYEPKLNKEQYTLLAGCLENIKLFRRPITAARLRRLLTGRPADPLQVMNQLPLVYLFDELRKCGYIKKAWMTVAFENKDFISFRTPGMERRYGSGPHYLTMEQLKSRRSDSKRCYIDGGNEIDDAIEQMKKCEAKRL